MKKLVLLLAAGLLMMVPDASAQDEPALVFGAYYRCNVAMEARADELMEQIVGPVVQRHVDAGHLTGWSWLTHSMGGAWRRLMVMTGTDMNQMMEMRAQILQEVSANHADEMEDFNRACASHDDYIWYGIVNSTNDPDAAGTASVSSYHMCDRAQEARADHIFEQVLAPLYEKHRAAGHIASYAFYGHRFGGVIRRLETVSGADHATVLEMQGAVYTEANETNPLAMQEFAQICRTHTDYMWTNTANN